MVAHPLLVQAVVHVVDLVLSATHVLLVVSHLYAWYFRPLHTFLTVQSESLEQASAEEAATWKHRQCTASEDREADGLKQ